MVIGFCILRVQFSLLNSLDGTLKGSAVGLQRAFELTVAVASVLSGKGKQDACQKGYQKFSSSYCDIAHIKLGVL